MTATDDPMPGVLLIPHAAIPVSGSFEVKYPDTRESEYFYFEENRERRRHLQVMTRAEALKVTQAKAWEAQEGARSKGDMAWGPRMTVWIHVDTSKQASRLALKVKSAPSLQVYRTGR